MPTKNSKALCFGDFKSVVLTNGQCVFERYHDGEKVFVAINAADNEYRAYFESGAATGTDLITGNTVSFEGGLVMPPYSAMFIRM